MPQVKPKIQPAENIYTDELEFAKPADRLIEAIEQRLTRQGEEVSKEKVLLIANQILESRK